MPTPGSLPPLLTVPNYKWYCGHTTHACSPSHSHAPLSSRHAHTLQHTNVRQTLLNMLTSLIQCSHGMLSLKLWFQALHKKHLKLHLEGTECRRSITQCKGDSIITLYNTIQYNTIQYNTIQYNIVYFQQRTHLHYNKKIYPTLGWLERGWTEE